YFLQRRIDKCVQEQTKCCQSCCQPVEKVTENKNSRGSCNDRKSPSFRHTHPARRYRSFRRTFHLCIRIFFHYLVDGIGTPCYQHPTCKEQEYHFPKVHIAF